MGTKDQYCRECGKAVPRDASSCPNCGNRVSQSAQSGVRLSVDTQRTKRTQSTSFGDMLPVSASERSNRYQMADGFILNTQTGDVWKYEEKSNKLKIVEREDSPLTSVEKAKAYIDQSEEIDRLVGAWEEKLSEIGDDSQLANIDLQNTLQKQQQTIQMLSNISKVLHDTAMGVIRKIG